MTIESAYSGHVFGTCRTILETIGRHLEHGSLVITLPDGESLHFTGPRSGPTARLHLHDMRALRRTLTGGDIALAEAYLDEEWDSPDLAAFLELGALNEAAWATWLAGRVWFRLLQRVLHGVRPNTRRGARRNVAYHYDLGNDFYAAWLDPGMTYSSAVFDRPDQDLMEAQANKYRLIAEKADLQPGDRVLEIGCGWGGFAEFAARDFGCRVTGITLSAAQHEFATRRIAEAGLADRVSIERVDYRDVGDRFDKVVSIEMFEQVGESYWRTFFERLRGSLRDGGTAALQVITIDDRVFGHYRTRADFIQRHVFPGGMLPSAPILYDLIGEARFDLADATRHGGDYAATLAAWRSRFEANWPQLRDLGCSERFRRLWRYYLSYCEAGFRVGRVDVRQIALTKA